MNENQNEICVVCGADDACVHGRERGFSGQYGSTEHDFSYNIRLKGDAVHGWICDACASRLIAEGRFEKVREMGGILPDVSEGAIAAMCAEGRADMLEQISQLGLGDTILPVGWEKEYDRVDRFIVPNEFDIPEDAEPRDPRDVAYDMVAKFIPTDRADPNLFGAMYQLATEFIIFAGGVPDERDDAEYDRRFAKERRMEREFLKACVEQIDAEIAKSGDN